MQRNSLCRKLWLGVPLPILFIYEIFGLNAVRERRYSGSSGTETGIQTCQSSPQPSFFLVL